MRSLPCPARAVGAAFPATAALLGAIVPILLLVPPVPSSAAPALKPTALTKYVDALPIPSVIAPVRTGPSGEPFYVVRMTEFKQKLHRNLAHTAVWSYNGSYPGPSFEAQRGVPIFVQWIDDLPTRHLFNVDTQIHGAEYPENPYVRNVVHLHGSHSPSASDGLPMDWFTPGQSKTAWYPNSQPATTLWYHDHAMGLGRLNIYAGLAGFYFLRDAGEAQLNLPSGRYEIPLMIQDRSFTRDGQLFYFESWQPEFFGDVALVNGKVWPRLTVEPRKYRFRFLDASNARFYDLKLFESDASGQLRMVSGQPVPGPAFYQIGSDGGFLPAPIKLNDPTDPIRRGSCWASPSAPT